jgi:hypothetical protein
MEIERRQLAKISVKYIYFLRVRTIQNCLVTGKIM